MTEIDHDRTPQAEELPPIPVEKGWPLPKSTSMDMVDDKCMTGSYSEIVDKRWLDHAASIEEEKPESVQDMKEETDASTPVCESYGYDPTQAFLAEERINAFLKLSLEQPSTSEDSPAKSGISKTSSPSQDASSGTLVNNSDQAQYDEENDCFAYVSEEWLEQINSSSNPFSPQNFPYSQCRNWRLRREPRFAIDPTVIHDIEAHARQIATSMDTLIENLTGTLHSISSLTVDCIETYCTSVCKTCDAVDFNIKSMYQLMAKCEELSKSMKPVYKLHDQVKEIRRLLDMFEGIVLSSGT